MSNYEIINTENEWTTSELEGEILKYDLEVEPFSSDFILEMLNRWAEDIDNGDLNVSSDVEMSEAIQYIYDVMCEKLTHE